STSFHVLEFTVNILFLTVAVFRDTYSDTIIPIGKYYYCYTDTIRNFGMVIARETGKILGINQNDEVLFEVVKYDDGPDYVENGLFRILKNNKYGYANVNGEVSIEPKFDCAHPFFMGKAQVSDSCTIKTSNGQKVFLSNSWYYIDINGNRVKNGAPQ
ncbi:WG repeat-containing protein, partial [Ulvibacterium marinum]|uniref:WG repeat-containing protein n=1 Tax=Ulvibacterium marinum TaxID=2419782 RepID=UPI0031EA4A33